VASSAIYFADRHMKMPGNYFRGFPALWNAAAFYLILLRLPPWLNAAVIALLVVFTFVNLPFLHPLRVKHLRALNIAALAVWSVLALTALWRDMAPELWVTVGLCVIAAYVLVAGLMRTPE